jgi:uncharacterized protein YlxP (DUF503 family)
MLVGVALFEIGIPHAQSLKEKRAVVKSLREKLRHRFEFAAAEVGLHDLHQRARLAVAFISLDQAGADGMFESVLRYIEASIDGTVGGWTTEVLDFDENATLGIPGFDFS